MIDKKQINKLLELYYKGESTLEEEKRLKRFFESKEVPKELEEEKEIFLSVIDFQIENQLKEEDYDCGIKDLINDLESKEKLSKEKNYKIQLRAWIIASAASVILLLGTGFTFYLNRDRLPKDTYTNPCEAEKKVDETLSLIACKFKLGIKEAKNAKREIIKTKKEVNKQIKGYE